MSKFGLRTASLLLMIGHLAILFYWVTDWQKLVTLTGLVLWIISIVLGGILYVGFRNLKHTEKLNIVFGRTVLASTTMLLLLAVLSVVIEVITRSMP